MSLKVLVMVLSLTGSCARSGAAVSDVTKAFTAPGGYMDFFNDCSYGAMTYDRTAFRVSASLGMYSTCRTTRL